MAMPRSRWVSDACVRSVSRILANWFLLLYIALIWQLMRAYTLSILSRLANTGNPIIEKEIVQWVNTRLSDAGKQSQLRNFNDPAIADGKIVIDLIDSIKAGSINYELVRTSGTQEVSLRPPLLLTLSHSLCLSRRITWPMPNMPYQWPARSAPVSTHCPRTLPRSSPRW